jgi:DNA-binding NtrC family response regulator
MRKESATLNSNSKKEKIDGSFDHLMEEFLDKGELPLKKFIHYVEVSLIVSSLEESKGNQKEAAKILSIKYTTLNEKMKRYNIGFRKVPIFNGKNES